MYIMQGEEPLQVRGLRIYSQMYGAKLYISGVTIIIEASVPYPSLFATMKCKTLSLLKKAFQKFSIEQIDSCK